MSRELFLDALPAENGSLNIILIGYRNGASPKIERIGSEDFFQRLQSVLSWPTETTTRLRDKLSQGGRLTQERLESPTSHQLRELGFTNL
jgi:hypothetical protein